jgi:type III pantothenate kinase
LLPVLAATGLPVWHLRHDACPGLGIHYPRPAEIGPDRLANCIGAQVLHGAPAVVIDMGTAVTFDILTSAGYEGGIIAPGLGVMTRYLHEQTALLPALDPDDLLVSTGIGKSTLDAMRLGCAVGCAGMSDALLTSVLQQPVWGTAAPAILATGGTAGALPKSWATRIQWKPELTLLGLEEVFLRGQATAKTPEK